MPVSLELLLKSLCVWTYYSCISENKDTNDIFLFQHQAMKRHNEAWQDSLRYRRPDLDRMSGIRRITLNANPMIGEKGAKALAEALKDDLWLKGEH